MNSLTSSRPVSCTPSNTEFPLPPTLPEKTDREPEAPSSAEGVSPFPEGFGVAQTPLPCTYDAKTGADDQRPARLLGSQGGHGGNEVSPVWTRYIEHPGVESTAAFLRLDDRSPPIAHHSDMPEWSRLGSQHSLGRGRFQCMVEPSGPVDTGRVACSTRRSKPPHLPDGCCAGDRSTEPCSTGGWVGRGGW